jgi:nitrogen regulatory protein P-II 1
MTKVQAIVRPEVLDDVVERLLLIGVEYVTIVQVKGAGRTGGRRAVYRGGAYEVEFVPKLMLEWYGADDRADAVVRAIIQKAVTGKIGDGKIFVEHVYEAFETAVEA